MKGFLTNQTLLTLGKGKTYEKTEREKGTCRSDSYLASFSRLIDLWSDQRIFDQRQKRAHSIKHIRADDHIRADVCEFIGGERRRTNYWRHNYWRHNAVDADLRLEFE
jgi:hypothetical protein